MKLYVGRLGSTVRSVEVEDLFGKYGRLVSVELKDGGYGYVEFGEGLMRRMDAVVVELKRNKSRISVKSSSFIIDVGYN